MFHFLGHSFLIKVVQKQKMKIIYLDIQLILDLTFCFTKESSPHFASNVKQI